MHKINFIKSIVILSARFDVTWDKTTDGAEFSWGNCTINIGIKSVNKDPDYTIGVISHELMELILVAMGGRYSQPREGSYLFNFNHQTFENAIQIHTEALLKFIKK